MSDQEQEQIYKPTDDKAKSTYKGPKKLGKKFEFVKESSLMDGLDELVEKGNLADQYKQQGGQ